MAEETEIIALIGTTWPVFIGLTVVLMGGASAITGQALARTWKPGWHVVGYGILIGGADRFLNFGLFEGELLSISAYLIDTAVLIALGLIAFQITRAQNMVSQYPWIYQRAGLFSWREKPPEPGLQTDSTTIKQ